MSLFQNIKTLERVVVVDTARNTTTGHVGQRMVVYTPAGVDSHLLVCEYDQFHSEFQAV